MSAPRALAVAPSISLPSYLSIFHSVDSATHGVFDNSPTSVDLEVPGLLDVGSERGLRCAALYNWEPLRHVSRPGSLAFSYFRDGIERDPGADLLIARETAIYLATDSPDVLVVYFGTLDETGHRFGWMSREYLEQLEVVDRAVATVLRSLNEDNRGSSAKRSRRPRTLAR